MKLKYFKSESTTINSSVGEIVVKDGNCEVSNDQGEFLLKNFPRAFTKVAEPVNPQITDSVTQAAPKAAPVAVPVKKK